MEIHESRRQAWIAERLTRLDKALTDDEADALENYVMCESILGGSARTLDFDRVRGNGNCEPLNERWIAKLAKHNVVRGYLSKREMETLSIFVKMMSTEDAPSEAEAAILLGLPGRDKRSAWIECIRTIAGKLVRD
jgi:hypothetical protein